MLIELFCLLGALGASITGSIWWWPVSHWYDFYRPLLLLLSGYLAGFLVIFIIYWIAALFAKKNKKGEERPSKWSIFWFDNAVWYICFHALVKLEVKGIEKMPGKNTKFLMVCNHRSKFDPMLVAKKWGKRKIAFITKKENLKIILANCFMPGMCYMPIDRDDKLQSLEVMKKSIRLISNNEASVGVYPEGKRNYGVDIGEFHEGVFNIAIHAKCPLVVTTIRGTENIKKNFPKPTKVIFKFECVLQPEEFEGMTAKALSDMVHDIMYQSLKGSVEKINEETK